MGEELSEEHAPVVELPPNAIVVRGGAMADRDLERSVAAHHADPDCREEWALSVSSSPDATAAKIVEASIWLNHRTYRWTRASKLFDAGYRVIEDEPPHALVLLPGPMTPKIGGELRAVFDTEEENPYHGERKLHSGKP
ncbi:MAG: hypothetical protein ACRENX_01815 [Candidatus Dormibacteria bacterium]